MNNEYRNALLSKFGTPRHGMHKSPVDNDPNGFAWEYGKDIYAVVTQHWVGVMVEWDGTRMLCGDSGIDVSKAMQELNLVPEQWDLIVSLYQTLNSVFIVDSSNALSRKR